MAVYNRHDYATALPQIEKNIAAQDERMESQGERIDAIEAQISGLSGILYPVGSYYETSDANFDPSVAWGGTWTVQTPADVLATSKDVTVSSAASYYSDTVTLLANTKYIILSHTNGGQSSSINTMSQIEVRSGTASAVYNPVSRTTTAGGQGVTSWAYIRTGSGSVTVSARCYGYYTTSHTENVRLVAIPLDKSVGAYRWHRTA